jgi:tetratricopeptide (TPR) repeat protein
MGDGITEMKEHHLTLIGQTAADQVAAMGGDAMAQQKAYHDALDAQNCAGALAAYEEALRVNPTDVATMTDLGRMYFASGDWEKARKIYQSLVLQNLNADVKRPAHRPDRGGNENWNGDARTKNECALNSYACRPGAGICWLRRCRRGHDFSDTAGGDGPKIRGAAADAVPHW